jgi:hypothetical protein
MEIPQGNTLENSGKQNPKMGFKSSRAFKWLLLRNLRFTTAMPIPADFIPLTALPISAPEWALIISFNGNKRER